MSTRAAVLLMVMALLVVACAGGGSDGSSGDADAVTDGAVSPLLSVELATEVESAIPASMAVAFEDLITTSPQEYCQMAVGADGHVQPSGHSDDFWCVWDDGRRERLDHDEGCRFSSGNPDGFTRVVDPWQPWLSSCHVPAPSP